jgi:AcrR family transcriptional regulator
VRDNEDGPRRRSRPVESVRKAGASTSKRAQPVKPSLPPRSVRGSEAREDILAAARVVFSRRGYGGTRFEDVAAEAGTSRTAVYHYFSSRRELFIEVGRIALLEWRDILVVARAIPTAWTPANLGVFIDSYLLYLDVHGSVIWTWTQATWDDADLRDSGLRAQLRNYEALGKELARLRGSKKLDPVQDGIVFLAAIERLWYFARNGGAGIGDAAMRRTLQAELASLLRLPKR